MIYDEYSKYDASETTDKKDDQTLYIKTPVQPQDIHIGMSKKNNSKYDDQIGWGSIVDKSG